MSINTSFTDVKIQKAQSGFYQNNSVPIALMSQSIMMALVLWALIWPGNANETLGSWNSNLLAMFNQFYVIIVGFFAFFYLSSR